MDGSENNDELDFRAEIETFKKKRKRIRKET